MENQLNLCDVHSVLIKGSFSNQICDHGEAKHLSKIQVTVKVGLV